MIAKMEFGKTGHLSSRILFGAAAFWATPQPEADRVLELLLSHGINHIDVAASYGEAELHVGPWMDHYRADFFLASKTGERTSAKAREEIHRSLERLHTDHLDLIQLHAVTTHEELDAAMGPGGALEAAVDARREGLVRFIGITSHTLLAPVIHMKALERFDFASVLLPYNYPMMQIPQYAQEFEQLASICKQRGVALQTIKAVCRRPWPENAEHFANCWYEPLVEQADVDRAVDYVLAQPQLFLNSVGDIQILAKVLDAASRFQGKPSDAEMEQMVADREMIPLWPEHEGMH